MVQELDLYQLDARVGDPTLTFRGAFNRAANRLAASQKTGQFVGRALIAHVTDSEEQLTAAATVYAQFAPDSPGSDRAIVENNARIAATDHVNAKVGTPEGRGIIATLIEIPDVTTQIAVKPFQLVQ